jgi:hypothetical protein
VKYWDNKGLVYKTAGMDPVRWAAVASHNIHEGRVKDPKVLVVMFDVDFNNRNWAMETLEYYREYNEMAAHEDMLILYMASDGMDERLKRIIRLVGEVGVIFHIALDKVYLDLSTVFLAGSKLNEIPGFVYKDLKGKAVTNPDKAVEHIGSIPVLNITDMWQDKVSHLYSAPKSANMLKPIDFERHIHSACGRKMAEGMKLEHTYEDPEDPELLKHWENMGLKYESHLKNGQQWVTLVPLCAYDNPAKKLPVMAVFMEVTSKFQTVGALSCYYGYCDIAAQGELILLFFVLETPDDNDLLYDILQDAAEIYPVDKSRVYVTGHSHNGHYASEFVRRHPRAVAAEASLGYWHGISAPAYSNEAVIVTDAMIEKMATCQLLTSEDISRT